MGHETHGKRLIERFCESWEERVSGERLLCRDVNADRLAPSSPRFLNDLSGANEVFPDMAWRLHTKLSQSHLTHLRSQPKSRSSNPSTSTRNDRGFSLFSRQQRFSSPGTQSYGRQECRAKERRWLLSWLRLIRLFQPTPRYEAEASGYTDQLRQGTVRCRNNRTRKSCLEEAGPL